MCVFMSRNEEVIGLHEDFARFEPVLRATVAHAGTKVSEDLARTKGQRHTGTILCSKERPQYQTWDITVENFGTAAFERLFVFCMSFID